MKFRALCVPNRAPLHDKVYRAGGWQDGWKAAAARYMAVEFRVEWQTKPCDAAAGGRHERSPSVTGSTWVSSLVRGGRTGLMTRSRQLDCGTFQR